MELIFQINLLIIHICKGGFTQECFFTVISQILNNYKKENPQRKILIIIDNAKIHKGKIIQNFLSPFQIILFLPPYTPQLNPIEYAFSKLKKFYKNSKQRTEKQVINALWDASRMISKINSIGYFKKIFSNIRKALNMEDLL